MSAALEALTSRIETALVDPLTRLGLDLEAVEVSNAGKRRVVRVAVDRDGGVTMDDVADATRVVGEVLETDVAQALGQLPYTLEVTSRGVDRPLTLPRHWRRNIDRLVKVTLTDGSSVTGRIGEVDESDQPDQPEQPDQPDQRAGGVVLEVSGLQQHIAYAEVERALVQIEFNRRPTGPSPDELRTDPHDEDDQLDDEMDDEMADEAEGDDD